ncbi:MAG: aminoacyl-tRNA hydrolase [Acidobacteria bacterium]|nr:aminoacyl-tRNA hydrolase [Acidobacteriota bacterium]
MVVGLGNPGARYEETRHNIGFRVVESVARERNLRWRRFGWFRPLALVAADDPVILVKPRTYMNRSGIAAAALCRRHCIAPRAVVAVHDDADLELGRLQLKRSGGSGGHNGLRSLTEELETPDYPRVRLGVRGAKRNRSDLAEYLLSPFDDDELPRVDALVADAARAVNTILEDDLEKAMGRYNRRRVDARETIR